MYYKASGKRILLTFIQARKTQSSIKFHGPKIGIQLLLPQRSKRPKISSNTLNDQETSKIDESTPSTVVASMCMDGSKLRGNFPSDSTMEWPPNPGTILICLWLFLSVVLVQCRRSVDFVV